MNNYYKLATHISEKKRKDEIMDATKIMAHGASLGLDVEVSMGMTSRKNFQIRVAIRESGTEQYKTAFVQATRTLPQKSFMRYAESDIVNLAIIDCIEEAARKRRRS